LSFIENRGQVDHRVNYYLQGAGSSLYFTSRGLTLSLGGKTDRWVVQQRFLTGRTVEPQARDPLPGVVSYFNGSPEEWVTAIPTYAEVAYRDLWPGVDLVYSGNGTALKYDLVLRPGADPSAIRMAYRGATGLEVTPAGRLRVSTGAGTFREDRPYAYQELAGRRVPVSASYVLGPRGAYGFHLGDYDPTRPLVIDPVMFIYAGYIGGSDDDRGFGVSVDDGGNAYVTGSTYSTEATFPETVGPDTSSTGFADAFVAKVDPGGTGLVYAGFIGGTGVEDGLGIAVDDAGNAYVAGSTSSPATTFPVTVGPGTAYNGGPRDGFVAKVNPGGTGLLYAGYLGGSGDDRANGVAVDGGGNAYVAGDTNSSEATFPASVGPDTTYNGGSGTGGDAFVAKVDATGAALVYAGYIGGLGNDRGFGVDVDEGGNAYVVGETDSTEATFPATVGPDTTHNRYSDGFLAKVNPAGTGLVYAGYIGGFVNDRGFGVAVDEGGNAYVVGETDSPPGLKSGFLTTVGPDTSHNGGLDAFVAKVNSAGTGFVYLGYIGGSSFDGGRGVAVDDAGNAYVTGRTASSEATFPATVGPDTSYNGLPGRSDAFVAKVNPAGTGLVYAGYIGGDGWDLGTGVAVDGAGNAYVTGNTDSTAATFPVRVGPDTSFNGGFFDAFVAKVGESPSGVDLALTKTDSPDPASPKKILTYSLTVSNDGPGVATGVTVEDQLPPSVTFVSANASRGNCTQAAGVVTCDLNFVAVGEQVTVTINVVPQSTGTITNSAEVSATEPDANPANNSDVETTEVSQGSTCVKPCT
jgi:uncharacterized repeat protein (TIGR01451 family)